MLLYCCHHISKPLLLVTSFQLSTEEMKPKTFRVLLLFLFFGTFNVSLVLDGLKGGTAGQELLQLVPGLLVLGGVHAG